MLGTVQGLLLWTLLPRDPLPYLAATGAAIIAASWIAGRAERALGEHDSPRIVIDEIVGFWVAAAGLPREWAAAALAFALFRVFDAWKLPPYRWLERLPGGLGVVADDVGAGAVAALAARCILGRWGWS